MSKKELTSAQKQLDIDLWIVMIASLATLVAYIAFQSQISEFSRNGEQNILLRVFLPAVFQFGLAGLGISIVAIIRKESFLSYGLRRKSAIASIALCCVYSYTER